jgi:hypothetical protein
MDTLTSFGVRSVVFFLIQGLPICSLAYALMLTARALNRSAETTQASARTIELLEAELQRRN